MSDRYSPRTWAADCKASLNASQRRRRHARRRQLAVDIAAFALIVTAFVWWFA